MTKSVEMYRKKRTSALDTIVTDECVCVAITEIKISTNLRITTRVITLITNAINVIILVVIINVKGKNSFAKTRNEMKRIDMT